MIMFQLNYFKGQFCFVSCCALFCDLQMQELQIVGLILSSSVCVMYFGRRNYFCFLD